MDYERQTAAANLARSEGYKKTASQRKKNGHKSEDVYATFFNGRVVKGQGKTDVVCGKYNECTVKAPQGGKVQMLLQVTDNVAQRWGNDHPMYLASAAQRAYYEDRHHNDGRNQHMLYAEAKQQVAKLVEWLNQSNNFREVLEYALFNDGEVKHMVDMYQTNNEIAYITKSSDFIDEIMRRNPVAVPTRKSKLRVAVSILNDKVDKQGNPKTRVAFSLEVRSNAKHCKSFLHKMEGGVVFPLVRKNGACIKEVNSNYEQI
jgi:hypothetical protein